jgi:hypothetical protein
MTTQPQVLVRPSSVQVSIDWKAILKSSAIIFVLGNIVSLIIPVFYAVYVGIQNNGNIPEINHRVDEFTNSYWLISIYWAVLAAAALWRGRVLGRTTASAVVHGLLAGALMMLNQFTLNALLEVTNGNGVGSPAVLFLEWGVALGGLLALGLIPALRKAAASGLGLALALALVAGPLLHPLLVTLAANADVETTIQIIVMWVITLGGAALGAALASRSK